MTKEAQPSAAVLAETFRTLREQRSWTLREAAGRIGCSAPFLCDVERARRTPSPAVVIKAAKAYGLGRPHHAKSATDWLLEVLVSVHTERARADIIRAVERAKASPLPPRSR